MLKDVRGFLVDTRAKNGCLSRIKMAPRPLAVLLAATACAMAGGASAVPTKPHVMLVVADDLG